MKYFLRPVLIGCTVLSMAIWHIPATAGMFDDDEARKAILDLRAKVNKLNDQVNAKADKTVALDQLNQFDAIRQEIAQLRGQVEVLSNEVSQQKSFYTDLDQRLSKLEPKKVLVDGKEERVDQNEQKSYDNALAIFQSGDYSGAATALSSFIRIYPRSIYISDARYSLGTAYYAKKDYKNAIANFQSLVKAHPNHPKAPDAMLNIASCYLEQKDIASAKRALENLRTQYPDSNAAKTAVDRLNALK